MSTRPGRAALVMSGGGARAAYQVGILQAIARMLPPGAPNPFPVICGTSAGAINAATLGAGSADFSRAVTRLVELWGGLHAGDIYHTDPWPVLCNSARWLAALATSALAHTRPVSLLDNAPLRILLHRGVDLSGIRAGIDGGHLEALCVTACCYDSSKSISFFEGRAGLAPWQRARRVGCAARIEHVHLLASSAIPFVFPPVRVGAEYYGDGCMQQLAPISPALHLGADRVLVVGVGRPLTWAEQHICPTGYPSLAQIAGRVLDSIFLDSLEMDLERLRRINHTLGLIPEATRARYGLSLRKVHAMVIRPSRRIDHIAARYAQELPRSIRMLMRGIGALRRSGGNLVSYLLFERAYCRELMRLGYEDAMARARELTSFLAGEPHTALGRPLAGAAAAPPPAPTVAASP